MAQPIIATAPNAGAPILGAEDLERLLGADQPVDQGGHAAGTLYVSPAGRVLLLKRSDTEGNFKGHWALPGGKAEEGESPEQAADREAGEELGGTAPKGSRRAIDRRTTPTGMTFTTFVQPVQEEFVPHLADGEHTEHTWASLDNLPEPMHPAVLSTLTERIGGDALDHDRLAQIEEPSANDSARGLAMDRDSVRSTDKYGRMRVRTANISKATINEYLGHEVPGWQALGLERDKLYRFLRDPEELAKAAPTFNNLPVLRRHVGVTALDHKPWDVVGSTGSDATFDGEYLKNSLGIWAQDAIDGVESGAQQELSSSYGWRPEMTAGKFGGKAFDGIMRDIVGNHVALVETGRAGPDVLVGDSNEEIERMSNREIAKTLAAVAARQVTIGALAAYFRPKLAMDAAVGKVPYAKIFSGVRGDKFAQQRPEIQKRIVTEVTPFLAKDASLDDVGKVLELLDKHEVGAGDVDVTDPQHNAMAAAAEPMAAVEKKPTAFDAEGFSAFLKGKGMADDDVSTAMGMLPQPEIAGDEKDEDADKDKKDDDDKGGKAPPFGKKANDADPDDKDKGKDKPMDKQAMDAAIGAAVSGATKTARADALKDFQAIRQAEGKVRPYVGDVSHIAFDSAEAVTRHALKILGVKDADKLHVDALDTVLACQQKIGARAPERIAAVTDLAQDAEVKTTFAKKFPDAARIKAA